MYFINSYSITQKWLETIKKGSIGKIKQPIKKKSLSVEKLVNLIKIRKKMLRHCNNICILI